ncbi:MAG: hypothetical protein WDN69_11245 [Aliidongia sp.]
MTRTGPAKTVDRAYATGRLANARSYLQAARDSFALAREGSNANPVMSQIINSAIAFTDALTASRKSLVNQQDHGAAVKLLREAFGRDLPVAQERQLRRILEDKDEVQYGVSIGRYTEAEERLADLEAYAAWAERQLIGS